MLKVRNAVPDDAAAIVKMVDLLCLHEGKPHTTMTAEDFVRDSFGADPDLSTLVCERNHEIVGYLSYYWGYDLETGKRGLHIADLFVVSPERGKGVGTMLVTALTGICKNNGGDWVQWFCQKTNGSAFNFYTGLGAKLEDDAVSFCLQGPRLDSMIENSRRGEQR
ncbi:MAG: GNAT family N-acetyltransferase [Planctomycetaceae bacterium]